MKIVINACYGGFSVNDATAKKLGFESRYDVDGNVRTDSRLIEMIEAGEDVNGNYACLTVVDVPDNATDYMINDYDGCESIYYVVDGKIQIGY